MRETKKARNEIMAYEQETYRSGTRRLMEYTAAVARRKREKSRKDV